MKIFLALLFFANITFADVLLFECAFDKNMNPDGYEDLSNEETVDGKSFTYTYNVDIDAGTATVTRNDTGYINAMERFGFSKVKKASITMEVDRILITYCGFEDNCNDTTDSINRVTLERIGGLKRLWGICNMQVGTINRKF